MKALVFAGVAAVLLMVSPAMAGSDIKVVVSKSTQTMRVVKDGATIYTWPVSTGARDRWTPNGTFKVQSFSKHHRSSRYNNAPMPHSIFFNGNIAAHGTFQENLLGQRASKGCVRLSRDNARTLYELVEKNRSGTVFVIQS